MIKKLTKLQSEGYNPNQLLEESIANGWQGIFPPKKQTQTKYLSADERARENTNWLKEEILRRRQNGEKERGCDHGSTDGIHRELP